MLSEALIYSGLNVAPNYARQIRVTWLLTEKDEKRAQVHILVSSLVPNTKYTLSFRYTENLLCELMKEHPIFFIQI